MQLSLNKKFGYFFGFLFLIFLGMAVLSLDNGQRFSRTSARIHQSREFLYQLSQILFAATDAKTVVNDFQLKQGKQKWELYSSNANSILKHIELAERAINGNEREMQQLEELRDMVQNRMAFLAQFVEKRKKSEESQGMDQMIEVVAANKAGVVMEEIRNQVALLDQEEHHQMDALINDQDFQSKHFNLKLVALLISSLVIIITAFLYLMFNLKARREAELSLLKNQQLLQSFFDNTKSVIFIKDLEGKYLMINKEYENFFNIRNDVITTKFDHEIFPADEVQRFHEQELLVINSGKPAVYEEKLEKSGTMFTYQMVMFPLIDPSGNVYAVGGIAADISDRKKAELALQEANDMLELRVGERTSELVKTNSVLKSALIARKKAEEELLTTNQFNYEIISNAGEGIIVYDNHLNHVLWNTFMEELTGIPSHKVLGRSVEKLFPHLVNQGFSQALHSVLKGEKVVTPDIKIDLAETKKTFWVSCVFSPHLNSEGEIIGVIGIIRDVTAKKGAEENLNFIDKQLNTFIYKSSHDLKGPLCSIMGLANLAKKEVQDPLSLKLFEMVEGRTQKLDDILKGLIDMMTIKEGKLSSEYIDLDKLIPETIHMLENLPGYSRLEFRLKTELTHEFFSDSKILRSILLSIVANSIKYQDYSVQQPFVSINVREKDEDVMMEISDNGEGIREEIQDKVFDIFFRDTNAASGSGLGLYIVKNAVEKLHGTISLQSREHVGTTFLIRLPRSRAA